jgi:hypothetical protein
LKFVCYGLQGKELPRNYAEKSINNLMDLVAGGSQPVRPKQ